MKTTIKLEAFKALVVEPAPGGVRAAIRIGSVDVGSFVLTPDQIGALIFGLEQAAEAGAIKRARAA